MKTLEQICEYKGGGNNNVLDNRDLNRLIKFIPEDKLESMGLHLKPEFVGKHVAKPFTREAVLAELQDDLDFAFEKALNRRGISSSLMFEVICMWNWVLEDGLESWTEETGYAQYGLPLYKATALKYGFDNPIADDDGNEFKYSAEADYV